MRMNLSPDFAPIPALPLMGNISQSLGVVEQLRRHRQQDAQLAQYTVALKCWQSERFRRTYADLLLDAHMGAAARFFLTELYSEQEFAQRDAEFARIAGTLERLFPQTVVQTATLLAQLHALSETLDAYMARRWIASQPQTAEMIRARALPVMQHDLYQSLWQSLGTVSGYSAARLAQINATRQLGQQLLNHTRVPGLRLMLKMMRVPATAAGLHHLQQFLETGFDTFALLGRFSKVDLFLSTIAARETDWLEQMKSPA